MSAWSKILSAEERAEVEAAVVHAYLGDDNSTRSHADAAAVFIEFMHDADRKGREWADLLWSEWAETGARNFARNLWSKRDAFSATALGKVRTKRLSRGVRRVDNDGRARWTSDSILTWTVEELDHAIIEEAQRRRDSDYNLHWMGAVRRLMTSTGAATIDTALHQIGKSLEEYLADEDAA